MLYLLKPELLQPELCDERSHDNGKPSKPSEEWTSFDETRESLGIAMKTQRSKNKNKYIKSNKDSKELWLIWIISIHIYCVRN